MVQVATGKRIPIEAHERIRQQLAFIGLDPGFYTAGRDKGQQQQ
jgi:hypothetical protein